MKLLIPIVLLVLGTSAGVGAGVFLGGGEETADLAHHCPEPAEAPSLEVALQEPNPEDVIPAEYAKLENQFVVPIVTDADIASLVVLTLSVEVPTGGKDIVLLAEPKLRDSFLQVLFEHANLGGFSGNFTSSSNMQILRSELLAAAQRVVGGNARNILVLDIVRQDS